MFVEGSAFLVVITLVILAVTRFFFLAKRVGQRNRPVKNRTEPCRTLVVIGSGGHTSEMLRIIGGLQFKNYSPRLYVVAQGDEMSQDKVKLLESSWQHKNDEDESVLSTIDRRGANCASIFHIKTVPRARRVLQSYFTSIFTTLIAIAHSFTLVFSFSPDLLLCNGPGTCIPICFWAYVLNFCGLRATVIVYVESLCRVQQLSLSGKLLYYLLMADHVYVQWPKMKQLYPRASYIGRVV